MNTIFKNIDIKKINNANFNTIFNQFNNYSFLGALKELQEKLANSSAPINDPSKLKFERDFQSNPQRPVQIPNRSQSVLGSNEQYILQNRETQRLANQFDSQIDSLFKPLIENDNREPSFNNYNFDKEGKNVRKRLEDVLQSRDTEVYVQRKPSESDVPDFLRSKPTSIRTMENEDQYRKNQPIRSQKNKNTNEKEENYLASVNEDETDLMSINNYDQMITDDDNFQEDSAPFQDRLNRLQNDRNNINIPQQKKVNFASEGFEDTFDNIQPTSINELKNKQKQPVQQYNQQPVQQYNQRQVQQYNQQPVQQYNQRPVQQYNQQPVQQYNQRQVQQYNQQPVQQYNQQPVQQYNQQPVQQYNQQPVQQYNQQPVQLSNQENTVVITKLSVNEKKEFIKIFDELKSLNSKLSEALKENKNIKKEQKEENTKLQELNTKLQEENTKLQEEKNELNKKLSDEYYDNIKNDIAEEFNKLKLLKDEYNITIENYNKISKIKNFVLEISSENNLTYYTYNFNRINNIISIKLTSYSIPEILYNIEDEKNNIFEFEINEEKNIIKIPSGRYEINNLIELLNKNEYELIFDLEPITNLVTIKHHSPFNIIITNLSYTNLGFTVNCNDKNEYVADKLWDLRFDDKVYLFLNNIDNTAPFGVLTYNGSPNAEIKFQDPIALDKLDILFKDSKGRECNFNDLDHNLSLTLEIVD